MERLFLPRADLGNKQNKSAGMASFGVFRKGPLFMNSRAKRPAILIRGKQHFPSRKNSEHIVGCKYHRSMIQSRELEMLYTKKGGNDE